VESNEPPSTDRIETPIGELPSVWAVEWLDDICSVNPDGFSEDDCTSDTFEYISLSDVSEGIILRSETTPADEAPSRAQRQIQEGDVLVGTVRPKQVSHGIVTEEHDGKICSSGFGVLRPPASLNPHYLIQEVLSRRFFRQMEAYVAGSGYPAVKVGDLRKHRIAVPSLEEQRKIASVLYTVDEAIQKTEEIINHTKRLRKALINDLFVSGYGETRATQHGYIGPRKVEYPRDWLSVELGNLTEKITKGKTPTSYGYDYTDSGVNFVKVESISDYGSIDTSEFDFISQDAHEHLSGSALENGDILFSIAGALGKVTKIDKELLPANTNQALALIRVDDSRAIPEYIRYYLDTTLIQKYIQSIATTTAQSNLNLKQISEFKILLPEVKQQKKILQVIHTVEAKLWSEESQKEQYQRLKRGLMQDLLSGKVRTTDTNIEVSEEITQHG
jgi:type I restriction enzyme S subunit